MILKKTTIKRGNCLMTELTEAHFELHSANKDRIYQKRKQAEEILKELLTKFKTDDLIDMLMKLDQEQD
jgi:hypothetical protein